MSRYTVCTNVVGEESCYGKIEEVGTNSTVCDDCGEVIFLDNEAHPDYHWAVVWDLMDTEVYTVHRGDKEPWQILLALADTMETAEDQEDHLDRNQHPEFAIN